MGSAQPAVVGVATGAVGMNNGLQGWDSKSVVQKTRGRGPLFIRKHLRSQIFEVFPSLDVLQRLIDELNATCEVNNMENERLQNASF